jgi:pimeloyl-ACP methyl ester carboxylesterase
MRAERGEDRYRHRSVHGAQYFTSRQLHDGLAVVVKRFPTRREPRDDDRAYVLVHGIGVSSRYFQPLASELARDGRVFLIDLPGYGAAPDPRREVTIADHAEVLASFLRRSELVNPVLVGHSWGAQVVSMLARDHPDVSDRIVLMAPTLEPSSRRFWAATRNLLRDALREPPVVFGIAVTDYLFRCGVPYLMKQAPYMIEDAIETRLGALQARVLIVNGDRDPVVSPAFAEGLSRLAPDIEFREVHGPHVIMHTDPVMIARHITEFLERQVKSLGGRGRP